MNNTKKDHSVSLFKDLIKVRESNGNIILYRMINGQLKRVDTLSQVKECSNGVCKNCQTKPTKTLSDVINKISKTK